MRRLWPVAALLLCTGCHAGVSIPLPAPAGVQVRAEGKGQAQVRVRAEAHFRPPPPPPPPPAPVPLEGAAVVEFFGVPLEGAQDVVFVLDRSGSMTDPAPGAIAALGGVPPAAGAPVASVGSEPPPIFADDATGGPPPANVPVEPSTAPPDGAPDAPSSDAGVEPAPQPTAPRKIDVARHELIETLTRLPVGTRLNVLFFNDSLEAYAPAIVPLDESGRGDLVTFVEDTEPSGSTALATAMRAAFVMGARQVVVLSDGLGNIGGGSDEILRDAREAMRGGVRIDTIGIGPDQDAGLLRTLANESGGVYQRF